MRPTRKALLGFSAFTLGLVMVPAAHSSELTCFGEKATLVGTEGPEIIYLTPNHRDVVVSLGGDDLIRTLPEWYGVDDAALDLICTGDGNDTVEGHGTRRIHGGPGDDDLSSASEKIFGSSGDDHIDFAPYMDGGPGNDWMSDRIACRATVIYGRGGDDTIYAGFREEPSASDPYDLSEHCEATQATAGGRDDDVVYGGSGNDWIHGGDNNDRLYGEDGRDRLIGGFGTDRCVGGAGTDTKQTCEKS